MMTEGLTTFFYITELKERIRNKIELEVIKYLKKILNVKPFMSV